MHKFDYLFIKKEFPSSFISVAQELGEKKEILRNKQKEYKATFTELQKAAKVASVKYSNAIEQIVSTDERIKAIVSNNAFPSNHDEEEIAGYSSALDYIFSNNQKISLSEDSIKTLHGLIYSKSLERTGGSYKSSNNLILEYDSMGNATIRFTPINADDTPQAMKQMILAYVNAKQEGVNDLILIPCVILDFLCIHPFTDGNGRISRLLTVLLYLLSDYDIVRYVSLEKEIEKNKEYYYEALKQSSEGWMENRNSYLPFIKFCLFVLKNCYTQLNNQFIAVTVKKGSKAKRVESIIVNSIEPISKETICGFLPDVSTATVQLALNQLVKKGIIKKVGTYRNARYIRK